MADPPGAQFPLDHFEFYVMRTESLDPIKIELQGQFDEKPRPARIYTGRFFAPATDKNAEGIRDKDAHLTWYNLEPYEPEPVRTVWISNQFDEQRYRIGSPNGLLVPAHKKGHADFGRVGHFKVYPVVAGDFEPREVRLRNQFEDDWHSVKVEYPHAFAVPVEKRGDGHEGPIHDPDTHLTIYGITAHSLQLEVGARDQFASYGMRLYRSIYLAVPTKKIEWGE